MFYKYLVTLIFSILLFRPAPKETMVSQYNISYSGVFNTRFERGKSFIELESFLNVYPASSEFYALPNQDNKRQNNDLELNIESDTLLKIVKDFSSEQLLFAEPTFNGETVHFRDSLHPMSWKLIDEKKFIDSLECLKAVTRFRGRDYTAWYCPGIAIPNGPWKLGGLPGLIVEAYENNKDLYFVLKQIHTIEPANNNPPAIENDYPDFVAYKKYWKDLLKKMDGALSATETGTGCVNCQTRTSSKVYMWEKWMD